MTIVLIGISTFQIGLKNKGQMGNPGILQIIDTASLRPNKKVFGTWYMFCHSGNWGYNLYNVYNT